MDDEYLVGRDLLVAPVVTEGLTKRRVYFPAGDDWVDWWTGKTYQGGTDADIDAPLERLPLFARAGAVIPTQPVIQHTGEMASSPLSLLVVRGRDGESLFYEDAGEGYEYARGSSRQTTATQRGGSLKLARSGSYAGARKVAALEFLPGQMPREVRVNGGRALLPLSRQPGGHDSVGIGPAEEFDEFTLVP